MCLYFVHLFTKHYHKLPAFICLLIQSFRVGCFAVLCHFLSLPRSDIQFMLRRLDICVVLQFH